MPPKEKKKKKNRGATTQEARIPPTEIADEVGAADIVLALMKLPLSPSRSGSAWILIKLVFIVGRRTGRILESTQLNKRQLQSQSGSPDGWAGGCWEGGGEHTGLNQCTA